MTSPDIMTHPSPAFSSNPRIPGSVVVGLTGHKSTLLSIGLWGSHGSDGGGGAARQVGVYIRVRTNEKMIGVNSFSFILFFFFLLWGVGVYITSPNKRSYDRS